MPQLFKPSFREYLWGELYLTVDSSEAFRYAIVDENTKTWFKPIKNLISSADNFVISTTYDLPFRTGQIVFLNGERYKIHRCGKIRTEINETVLRMWSEDDSAYWVLEVVR